MNNGKYTVLKTNPTGRRRYCRRCKGYTMVKSGMIKNYCRKCNLEYK